jgi:hypothetical protein
MIGVLHGSGRYYAVSRLAAPKVGETRATMAGVRDVAPALEIIRERNGSGKFA